MFIQKLKKNKIDDYVKIHRNAWPELILAAKEAGVGREMIWLKDDAIYLYVMAENFDKAMANLHKTEVCKKWMQVIEPYFEEIQDFHGEGNIIRLEKIFDLEKQLIEINK